MRFTPWNRFRPGSGESILAGPKAGAMDNGPSPPQFFECDLVGKGRGEKRFGFVPDRVQLIAVPMWWSLPPREGARCRSEPCRNEAEIRGYRYSMDKMSPAN
jgi:hypothetical protein